MLWHELYPEGVMPEMDAIADYMGAAKPLWLSFVDHVRERYGAKPKLTYSGCSGKPGWNVKFQKGGKALGTFYPEDGSFSALIVMGNKQAPSMEAALPNISPEAAELYLNADDYMKMGKWMMLRVDSPGALRDLKTIIAAKMA